MKVAFDAKLEANSALLEQVVHDGGRVKHTCSVKENLNKLAEARRVVVFERLCIAEGFQKWVGVEYLLFYRQVLLPLILLSFRLTRLLVE